MTTKNVATAFANFHAVEPASTGKALRERLKETTSLYESRRRMGPELPLEDICRQIFDHLIPAMHFPAMASAIIELDGRRFTSENFCEANTNELQANIVVLDKLRGRLRVFYPDNTSFLLPQEQELIDAIAADVERWLKEITCVYEIRRTAELELPLEDVCQQILKLIIPALQFPQLATVMIELDDKRFVSDLQEHGHTHELHSKITADNKASEQGTMHELQSNITVNNQLCGRLRVLYPQDTEFLLPEEQELIDAIAGGFQRWLKEANCLYEIRRNIGLELTAGEVCPKILEHLMPALQFPELATLVIELDGERYATASHEQELTHELHSNVYVANKLRGQLRVFYPLDKPFLIPEEQRLVDAVATELEKWIEAKKIDGTLRKRLEEVTCLYEIRRSLGGELSLDNACSIFLRT